MKHLKLSAVSSDRRKSSQVLLITDAYVVKSSDSFFWIFKHLHLLWNKDNLGLNNSFRSSIVSLNFKSCVFLGKMKSMNLLSSLVPSFESKSLIFSHRSMFDNRYRRNLGTFGRSIQKYDLPRDCS